MIVSDYLTPLLNASKPILMGIINVTPDSFYGDGIQTSSELIKQINIFNDAGVDIIDIGAESSRPGAISISSEQEIERLGNCLSLIKKHASALISVDTYKAETAKLVLSEGAHIINDISGGESNALLELVAKYNASIVLMHKQGQPSTMQDHPSYTDVVMNVKEVLSQSIEKARSFGISSIMIDPGIGFGKTLAHNLALLRHLDSFKTLNCPIVIGTSNKSFIGALCNADIHERLPGSLASIIECYRKGASIFRVHDVQATKQAFDVYRAINE